jgi:hypothetical protein
VEKSIVLVYPKYISLSVVIKTLEFGFGCVGYEINWRGEEQFREECCAMKIKRLT